MAPELYDSLMNQHYPLKEGRNTIGRSRDCDVVLPNEGGAGIYAHVSRRHAELELKDSHATIKDIGSRHGTFLNDLQVSNIPTAFDPTKPVTIRLGHLNLNYVPRDSSQTRDPKSVLADKLLDAIEKDPRFLVALL